jgi:predicted RNA methylase
MSFFLLLAVVLLVILLLTILLTFYALFSLIFSTIKGAPYIKNDDIVIFQSLKLCGLNSNTKFVDLGSGDGKVLFIANKFFNAESIEGYEISPWPYRISVFKNYLNGSKDKIKIYRKSIFEVDLSTYDVAYAYLLPSLLKKLKPQIIQALSISPDLLIVTPAFQIDGLKPIKIEKLFHRKFNQFINIYVYGKESI